jgi:hypothetical protein
VGALIELAAVHRLAGNESESARFRQLGLAAFDAMPDPGDGDREPYLRVLTYWREWGEEPELAVRLAQRLVVKALKRSPVDLRDVLELKHGLAWALLRNDQPDEALVTEREVAIGIEKQFGPRHGRCIELARDAQTLMVNAQKTNLDLFAFVRRSFGTEPTDSRLLALRGLELLEEQKWTEAEPILRDCLRQREAAQPDVWTTFNAKSMLGESLLGQKRYEQAESLLLDGYQGIKSREEKSDPIARVRATQAADRLAWLYEETDRPADAARWRKLAVLTEVGPTPRVK